MNGKMTRLLRVHKMLLLAFVDVLIILMSYFLALLLRFDMIFSNVPKEYITGYLVSMPYWVVVTLIIFYVCKLYHSVWRLVGVAEVQMILTAYILLGAAYVIGMLVMHLHMPRSYYFMGYIISLCLVVGVRFSYRLARHFLRRKQGNKQETERIMIIGGGSAGQALIKELMESDKIHKEVCCVIDDNPTKKGRMLEGVPIVGNRYDIVRMVDKYRINCIIYSIPAATGKNRRDIINICKETNCRLQTVPGIYQLVNGEVSVSTLRDVEITDLLGREQVKVNNEEIFAAIRDKVVLVTGGGGSIGLSLIHI